jgi:hypothetical protein
MKLSNTQHLFLNTRPLLNNKWLLAEEKSHLGNNQRAVSSSPIVADLISIALATQIEAVSSYCRSSAIGSQQVEKECRYLFGISSKSPYLCISFLIHMH